MEFKMNVHVYLGLILSNLGIIVIDFIKILYDSFLYFIALFCFVLFFLLSVTEFSWNSAFTLILKCFSKSQGSIKNQMPYVSCSFLGNLVLCSTTPYSCALNFHGNMCGFLLILFVPSTQWYLSMPFFKSGKLSSLLF